MMPRDWMGWGRVLWVLLALNGFYLFGLTLWIMGQQLAQPSPRILQGLAEAGLSLGGYSAFFFGAITILFFVFFIVSLLIFLRRPNDRFALLVAIFLYNYGAANAYPQYAEFINFYLHPPLWYAVPSILSGLFSWPLLVLFLAVYPDGQFVPRWVIPVCIAGGLLTVTWVLFPSAFADYPSPIAVFGTIATLALVSIALYARIWRYRHYALPLERQQTKWFLYALAIFFVFTVISVLLPPVLQLNPQPTLATGIYNDLLTTFSTLTFVVLPVAVGIAILRYRLWDIDILIRKTLTYSIVVALLLMIYFGSVISLQQIFAQLTNQRNEVITVVSTLAIAALFVPLRNRIQEFIDRRFYRKKYDAQQVLNDFAKTVRDETDLEKLTTRLLQVVDETMQPKSASIWLKRSKNPK